MWLDKFVARLHSTVWVHTIVAKTELAFDNWHYGRTLINTEIEWRFNFRTKGGFWVLHGLKIKLRQHIVKSIKARFAGAFKLVIVAI